MTAIVFYFTCAVIFSLVFRAHKTSEKIYFILLSGMFWPLFLIYLYMLD